MLECITAVSTALTALFAALTYLIVKRQAAVSRPVIKFEGSGDTADDYRSVSFAVAKPDDEKYRLVRLVVRNPDNARLAEKVSDRDNRAVPGDWKKSLDLGYYTSSTGVFMHAPRGAQVTISVHTCLKSDPKIKCSSDIMIAMHR